MNDDINSLLYDVETDKAQAGAVAKQMAEFATQAAGFKLSVDRAEEDLKAAEDMLRTLLEKTIPEFMMEAGVKAFKLGDGTKVEVNTFYRARLAQPEAGLKWLVDNGHGGVIKHAVTVPFGRDPGPEYQAVLGALAALDVPYQDVETVHPQTLTALVRELMERGEEVPAEAFGVYTGQVAKIKLAK